MTINNGGWPADWHKTTCTTRQWSRDGWPLRATWQQGMWDILWEGKNQGNTALRKSAGAIVVAIPCRPYFSANTSAQGFTYNKPISLWSETTIYTNLVVHYLVVLHFPTSSKVKINASHVDINGGRDLDLSCQKSRISHFSSSRIATLFVIWGYNHWLRDDVSLVLLTPAFSSSSRYVCSSAFPWFVPSFVFSSQAERRRGSIHS